MRKKKQIFRYLRHSQLRRTCMVGNASGQVEGTEDERSRSGLPGERFPSVSEV